MNRQEKAEFIAEVQAEIRETERKRDEAGRRMIRSTIAAALSPDGPDSPD